MRWAIFLFCAVLSAAPAAKKKKSLCRDKFEECVDHLDSCTSDPGYMVINCPVTCSTCHLRSAKVRCNPKFLNTSTEPVLYSGSTDLMFERIRDELGYKILSADPWVAEIDHFLSDQVVDELLAQVSEWEGSVETGQVLTTGDGTTIKTPSRTSVPAYSRQNLPASSHTQDSFRTHPVVEIRARTVLPTTYRFCP